jgi:hypothetical protein
MSVPPGTEMFQFPGFASNTYEFSAGYPLRGGLPHSDIRGSTIARISPRLFAACHVLHRLLAPRHPPDALLFLTSTHRPDRTLHAQPGQRALTQPSGFTCQRTAPQTPASASIHVDREAPPAAARAAGEWRRSDSNRRPPACKAGALPLSYAPITGTGHPANAGRHRRQHRLPRPCRGFCRKRQNRLIAPSGGFPSAAGRGKWAREDLNLRPHAYQACALTN